MSTMIVKVAEVKALLEKGWTAGAFARDALGYQVNPVSPEACKFCLLGAMRRVCNFDDTKDVERTADEYNAFTHFLYDKVDTGLAYMNDHLGYDAVMQFLDSVLKSGDPNGR